MHECLGKLLLKIDLQTIITVNAIKMSISTLKMTSGTRTCDENLTSVDSLRTLDSLRVEGALGAGTVGTFARVAPLRTCRAM